jgi:leucyl-tRNA synthetase
VQINGKLRFATEIPIPPPDMGTEKLSKWITERILETEEGRRRLVGGKIDVGGARKVIIVKGGRTVNYVL